MMTSRPGGEGSALVASLFSSPRTQVPQWASWELTAAIRRGARGSSSCLLASGAQVANAVIPVPMACTQRYGTCNRKQMALVHHRQKACHCLLLWPWRSFDTLSTMVVLHTTPANLCKVSNLVTQPPISLEEKWHTVKLGSLRCWAFH
jgi:hypothetical protein